MCSQMLYASAFKQNIGGWNTASVINMGSVRIAIHAG
jgi:surface protein